MHTVYDKKGPHGGPYGIEVKFIEMGSTMQTLQDRVRALRPWFHNLHLPDGTQTRPDHHFGDFPRCKWEQIEGFIPRDLGGWNCLDIGCNAGFYTFELARRGGRVLGIDVDDHYLKQARWASEQYGFTDRVRFRKMQVYDLARHVDRYDLVLFMGVFYHLRYPLLGLDIVAGHTDRMMIFQTLEMEQSDIYEKVRGHDFNDRKVLNEPGWPKLAFIEHEFSGDPTNWWAPNRAATEALLRSAGLKITARPGHEIYCCKPDREHPSCVTTWNRAEYDAATGTAQSATGTARSATGTARKRKNQRATPRSGESAAVRSE